MSHSPDRDASSSVADIRLRFESLTASSSSSLSSTESHAVYTDHLKAASTSSIPYLYTKTPSQPASTSPSPLSSSCSLSISAKPRNTVTPPTPKPKPLHLSKSSSNKPQLKPEAIIFQSDTTEVMGFNPSSSNDINDDATKYLNIPEGRIRPSPPVSRRSQERIPTSSTEGETPVPENIDKVKTPPMLPTRDQNNQIHNDIKQFLPPPVRRNTLTPDPVTPPQNLLPTPNSRLILNQPPNSTILPPPQRIIPAIYSPPSSSTVSLNELPEAPPRPNFLPPPPLPRRSIPNTTQITTEDNLETSDTEDLGGENLGESFHSYPDLSQVNRRPPIYEGMAHEIALKSNSEAKCLYIVNNLMVIYGSSTTKVMTVASGKVVWSHTHNETKVTVVGVIENGTHPLLWAGTKDGDLWEIDITVPGIKQRRNNIHFTPMVMIKANGSDIWTLSDDGKLAVWGTSTTASTSKFSLADSPKSYRVTAGFKAHMASSNAGLLYICKNKLISVYQPSLDSTVNFNVANGISATALSPIRPISEFTYAATIRSHPDKIFFSHEDGMVSVFSQFKMAMIDNVNVTGSRITSMCGVGDNLWIGLKSGFIMVCDVSQRPWKILKEWRAHNSAVVAISCDYSKDLPVATLGASDNVVLLWDGWLKADWIEADMLKHSEAFCNFRHIDIQVVTWNTGAAKPTDLEDDPVDATFLRQILSSSSSPEIIIFGFQELVDLDKKSVTAKSMFHSKKINPDNISISSHISHQYKDWQNWLSTTLDRLVKGSRYRMVQSSNMVGLFTCLFVKDTELSNINFVTSLSVKTGLGGLHGNKGGLIVRLLVDDSSLCFINCHLAAGHAGSINRNNDLANILDIKFPQDSDSMISTAGRGIFVNGGDGTMVLDHEACFLSGDLNYRIGLHRNLAIQYIKRGEFDKLYEADQLANQLKKKANFRLRAFQELPIKFAPTYKFDVRSDEYDTSEKRRVPAWCDRVFYKGNTEAIQPIAYTSHTVRVSDHRPVSGLFKVRVKTVNHERRTGAYKDCLDRWQIHFDEIFRATVNYT